MPPDTPLFFVIAATLLGLCVGSFLNVVIHRLPRMMAAAWQAECVEYLEETGNTPPSAPAPEEKLSLSQPRSRCPHCGKMITALQNIPLLSYLFLRGKCAACAAPISIRYPAVEVLTALLSLFAILRFGFTPAGVGALFFIWFLVALAFIDLDTQLLPDSLTLPLLWLGLLVNLGGYLTTLSSAVIGAIAGYLSLWTIYWIFKLLTGKEGMGYGDFKLLAALGAWLGWQMLPITILLSSVVGAIVGISLIIFAKHGRHIPIPFGPYLAAAGVSALFFGKDLTHIYLGLL